MPQRFPDVARAVARLRPRHLVIDAELAVFDESLVSRFHMLNAPPQPEQTGDPARADRLRLTARPRTRRPHAASHRAARDPRGRHRGVGRPAGAPAPCGRDGGVGRGERRGLEGFVAKDPRAPYRPGQTRSRRKVKLRHEGRFLIGGVALTKGGYASLLVGTTRGRRAPVRHYRRVGSGPADRRRGTPATTRVAKVAIHRRATAGRP
jgi:ATP-dependent DNA ligase